MKFEDLLVWQKSLNLTLVIHKMTLNFPKDELFILTSQIKRAADSISLNIAEGSQGQSNAEFNRFLGISLRSAIEVVACLHLAIKRELIDKETFEKTYKQTEEIIKMLQSLRKSIR